MASELRRYLSTFWVHLQVSANHTNLPDPPGSVIGGPWQQDGTDLGVGTMNQAQFVMKFGPWAGLCPSQVFVGMTVLLGIVTVLVFHIWAMTVKAERILVRYS